MFAEKEFGRLGFVLFAIRAGGPFSRKSVTSSRDLHRREVRECCYRAVEGRMRPRWLDLLTSRAGKWRKIAGYSCRLPDERNAEHHLTRPAGETATTAGRSVSHWHNMLKAKAMPVAAGRWISAYR